MKSTRRLVGRSLAPLTHSVSSLRTARFARALRCAYSFACSLTHSGARGTEPRGLCLWNARVDFIPFQPTVRRYDDYGWRHDDPLPQVHAFREICVFPVFASLRHEGVSVEYNCHRRRLSTAYEDDNQV